MHLTTHFRIIIIFIDVSINDILEILIVSDSINSNINLKIVILYYR